MTNGRALLLGALVALAGMTALGQTTSATLSGVVKDASGAVVPETKISIRNSQTGITRDITNDNEGRYSFTNLEPGQYELRAERTGFKTVVQSNVVLTVGGPRSWT